MGDKDKEQGVKTRGKMTRGATVRENEIEGGKHMLKAALD